MTQKKKEQTNEKTKMHPRNKHRERYDFKQLILSSPDLASYVKPNIYQDDSIDFFDPQAVRTLNKALLKHFYHIDNWNIPANYLCPPIPGRADYIHHLADILCSKNYGKLPIGNTIKCLEIGVGASCIYPIIGVSEYDWSFVASDIDPVSIESAQNIINSNPTLKDKIELRLQTNPKDSFYRIIQKGEYFDLTICNPPFHASLEEAQAGSLRKLNNLKKEKVKDPILNFGGQNAELWCEGGEVEFIINMIKQSKQFASSCFWFSSLVSKKTHLPSIYHNLKLAEAVDVKTIPMGQGNKTSHLIAWTFFTREKQKLAFQK